MRSVSFDLSSDAFLISNLPLANIPAIERIGISSMILGIIFSFILMFVRLLWVIIKSPKSSPATFLLFSISILACIFFKTVIMPVRVSLSETSFICRDDPDASVARTIKNEAVEISEGIR